MSPQIVDEMIDILKAAYNSQYQRYYQHVHRIAVECHEKDGGTRRIIEQTEEYRNRLLGQLDLMRASVGFAHPAVFDFFEEQESRLSTEFDSYSLFGVLMLEDGYIMGGDEAGRLVVKDQEAWKEAEKSVEESRKLKAERARRQEASVRL